MIPEENKLDKYVTLVVHSCMNKVTEIPSITGWKENNCTYSTFQKLNNFFKELGILEREIQRQAE